MRASPRSTARGSPPRSSHHSRCAANSSFVHQLADETVPIEVTALDSRDIDVNHPPMRSGRWAAAPEEIVLDYSVSVDLAIDDAAYAAELARLNASVARAGC